jgi:hypothetical protein
MSSSLSFQRNDDRLLFLGRQSQQLLNERQSITFEAE